MTRILPLAALLALAGCNTPPTPAQTQAIGTAAGAVIATIPAAAKTVLALCKEDAALQPVAVVLAPLAGAQVASIATLDAQLVHPSVVAACASVSATAKPVGVVTAATK